ncbi:uncharacterized protein LOC119524814 [Choloepus didactylus]|uniref:uncharacterized protein LOC119524814 n=1 Tax=Choloepus didactylus TaxID=27675 RepID=UPI00189C894C|nr:uncharacterized protein LOC119524814 [Choloepus didactylus]
MDRPGPRSGISRCWELGLSSAPQGSGWEGSVALLLSDGDDTLGWRPGGQRWVEGGLPPPGSVHPLLTCPHHTGAKPVLEAEQRLPAWERRADLWPPALHPPEPLSPSSPTTRPSTGQFHPERGRASGTNAAGIVVPGHVLVWTDLRSRRVVSIGRFEHALRHAPLEWKGRVHWLQKAGDRAESSQCGLVLSQKPTPQYPLSGRFSLPEAVSQLLTPERDLDVEFSVEKFVPHQRGRLGWWNPSCAGPPGGRPSVAASAQGGAALGARGVPPGLGGRWGWAPLSRSGDRAQGWGSGVCPSVTGHKRSRCLGDPIPAQRGRPR